MSCCCSTSEARRRLTSIEARSATSGAVGTVDESALRSVEVEADEEKERGQAGGQQHGDDPAGKGRQIESAISASGGREIERPRRPR